VVLRVEVMVMDNCQVSRKRHGQELGINAIIEYNTYADGPARKGIPEKEDRMVDPRRHDPEVISFIRSVFDGGDSRVPFVRTT
jgi:hypothetical protein